MDCLQNIALQTNAFTRESLGLRDLAHGRRGRFLDVAQVRHERHQVHLDKSQNRYGLHAGTPEYSAEDIGKPRCAQETTYFGD